MCLPVRALALAWVVSAASGCGRFGFDLQSLSADDRAPDSTRPDAALRSDASLDAGGTNGGTNGMAEYDGQVPWPGEGGSVSDASRDGAAGTLDPACSVPVSPTAPAPVHRYAFTGTGTQVTDLVGSAHGVVQGGASVASGSLTLDGADDFVDLPNGLISSLGATTIMLWVEWGSGPQRQVLFDFGSSDQGEGAAGNVVTGLSVLASKPATGLSARVKTASLDVNTATNTTLTLGTLHQVALEITPSSGRLRMYLDGIELRVVAAGTFSLSDINDVNVWLGRGQDSGDTFFRGTLHELRIYDRVLDECAVLAAALAGPDELSFARCAQPEQSCSFTPYGALGAWTCGTDRTWFVAAQTCADAGMQLVTINDQVENDRLAQALPNLSMWTGYNDITTEGSFLWCGSDSTFTAFAASEPSSTEPRDCVRHSTIDNEWRAVDCAAPAKFACEP